MDDLYKKYYFSLRKFVSNKIDDEGLVEELTNDILMAAIKSYISFDHKCGEFSWVCSIAKHKIIDYYRKKKLKTILFSTSEMFEEIADKALTPERDALKNELVGEIKKTMKEIGEGYREMLRLKYIDGLKVADMASMMKTSVKAVESKLIRAKAKFRTSWAYDTEKSK